MRSGEARSVGRGEKEAAGGADAHLRHILMMVIVKIRMKNIMSDILLIVRIRIIAKTMLLLIEWMIGLRQR